MKKVPIFIASSIREFEREREQFSEYLDMLNDVHERDGVEIDWKRPETMSRALHRGGSQLPYNKRITESRFFLLIVGEKLGKHTEAEFDVALEQFKKTGAPVILPYFLNVRADMGAIRFLERIRKELDIGEQYVDTYDNFDQILNNLHIELIRAGAFQGGAEPSDRETAARKGLDGIRELIAERRDKIAQLEAQPIAPQIIAEMTNAYEEIYRLVQTYKVEPNTLLNYMDFLWKQHVYDKGIKLGHWLEEFYSLENPGKATWASLKHIVATLYHESNQYEQGEKCYREALEIWRRLASKNSTQFEPNLANTCNNLGNLLYSTNRMEEAEECLRETLKIERRLASENSAIFASNLADAIENLAIQFWATARMKESEPMFREALEIRQHLVLENPSAFEPDVAQSYNNMGRLLADLNRLEEAEPNLLEALARERKLVAANPSAHEPLMALTYENLGRLERQRGNRDAAKGYFEKSLSLYEKFPHCDEDAQRIRDELAKL